MKSFLTLFLVTFLLFEGFLAATYKIIDAHLERQEISVMDAKEKWLFSMVGVECNVATYCVNKGDGNGYFFHYKKALYYFVLALDMVQNKINGLCK